MEMLKLNSKAPGTLRAFAAFLDVRLISHVGGGGLQRRKSRVPLGGRQLVLLICVRELVSTSPPPVPSPTAPAGDKQRRAVQGGVGRG